MRKMATGLLMAANASKIMIDGKDVAGVDSIDFKITRNRQNIHTISSEERIGAYFGALQVTGSIKVKSAYDALDKKMFEEIPKVASFQIVVELYPQSADKGIRKITFDECMLEDMSFGMSVNGVALTTYNFSSTRIRYE
jgi:predicted ester cyclase